ncbi:YecA family protein [Sulfitobacter noctilucae]|uniref:UPF0149 family protein n=1 Tax=Sulfitobacter noctilucae TaxID=1342302 RepID=UPI000467FB7F|nr:UPF0149 family protein [Sulfitobacter noctilucae]KIN61769.1 YecA family protein [Sulfitobacter noctilucae]
MLTEDELGQLNSLLLPHTDEHGMLLGEFDGLCTGLIVCPEMVMPGKWLPCVWGSIPERYEPLEDVQAAMDLIMRHYNDVALSLTPPVIEYGALYDEDKRTGEILWEW